MKLNDMLPSQTKGLLIKDIYSYKAKSLIQSAKTEILKVSAKTLSTIKRITKVMSPAEIVRRVKERAKKFISNISFSFTAKKELKRIERKEITTNEIDETKRNC